MADKFRLGGINGTGQQLLLRLSKALVYAGKIKGVNIAAVKIEISGSMIAVKMGINHKYRKVCNFFTKLSQVSVPKHGVVHNGRLGSNNQKSE